MVPASTTLIQDAQVGLENLAQFDDAIGWAILAVVCVWAIVFMIRSDH